MKSFIDDDFLLETEYARKLYHNFAKQLPVIDFHSHLSARDIAEDKQFSSITEIWLKGDHYKWRAMRALGIEEEYITGDKSDEEKFAKWMETIPYTLRNPLYHWSHLEMERYFGITELLKPEKTRNIYDQCNALLASPDFSARNLLKKMNVEVLCTTDDPLDDLKYHRQLKDENFEVKVLPTFRPDPLFQIEKENFLKYLEDLADLSGEKIIDYPSLLKGIKSRIDFFHGVGCRLSDHGLENAYSEEFTTEEIADIFSKRLGGTELSYKEIRKFRSALMLALGQFYAEMDWTMQLHLGPIRNTNSRLLERLGADAGVDSIGDFPQARPLAKFLDSLEKTDSLPKTILYNVNPSDNEVMATMAGNFMGGSRKGKVQHGSAWWFLDQKDGIEKQLNSLSNMGLLSCFVGMLTDSRSLLSFPRHEYFRRVLCNLFGNDIKKKEMAEDMEWIGKIIKDICYYNAKNYFEFPKMPQE